jgi:hypothetical protein
MPIVTVVETPEFQRRASQLLTDEERHAVIDYIARNPAAGISIGSGVRKVRFGRSGSGKSGGYRTIHFFASEEALPVFLLTVYAKTEKANLTPKESADIRKLVRQLADAYRKSP